MVTIVDYRVNENSEGKTFCSLILQGDLELVKSKQTGKFYATNRKASLSSTFDEKTCQALIGKQLPGTIEKEQCDPYEYAIPDTGEIILLSHRFRYVEVNVNVEKEVFA